MNSLLTWVRRHPVLPSGLAGMVVGMVLLGLLALGSGTAIALDRVYGVPDGAVFRAGDTVLTEPELATRAKLYGLLEGLGAPPNDPATLDKYHRAVAKAIAVQTVVDQASAERKIVIADKTASDNLNQLMERGFPGGRDQFLAGLQQAGVTERDFLDELKRRQASGRLFEQVTKDVKPPTDQEIAQTYEQRKAEMVSPEKRHLRIIAVQTEDEAKQVRAQLDQGTDFAAAAKQWSQDGKTKDVGGELGVATHDQVTDRPFADAAFATPGPNTYFGPVKTQTGIWGVGQVLEVAPGTPLSLDQMRDMLRSYLYQTKQGEVWNNWLHERLEDVGVRYADAYRPDDPTGLGPPPDQRTPAGAPGAPAVPAPVAPAPAASAPGAPAPAPVVEPAPAPPR